MNQFCLFSSGLELANLVVSSDLLRHSCNAISDLKRETNPNNPTSSLSVRYQEYQYPPDVIIIAFVAPTLSQLQEGNRLVSSEDLSAFFPHLEFISTKVNPSFSIHRAAATLFASVHDELSLLKHRVNNCTSLIVTGHSLGGSIASLFTLCLLDSISTKATSRPLCITFGAPLLGNDAFQRAILERPKWHSCFMHVVSDQDPIPRFVSPLNHLAAESASQTSSYMPFGTFLLCSKSGCACFKEPEIILELMLANRNQIHDLGLQIMHYVEILEYLKNKASCRGASVLGESVIDPFRAGIIAQLEAVGVIKAQQQLGDSVRNSVFNKTEEILRSSQRRSKIVFDPSRKLNDRKIDMTYLEWYKKVTGDQDGYYDSYKRQLKSRDEIISWEVIVKRQRLLTQYWKRIVDEVEKMPQKEGAMFRVRWLYAGTNYRRMIEPLDIAEFYKKGNKDYITKERSKHYILLEQWLHDDKPAGQPSNGNERIKACSLTEDSCFWAHVEEAILSCRLLKNAESDAESKESSKRNLIKFEQYVMGLINKRAVSPEIFLEQSSFMEWWREYEKIVRGSYHPLLTEFMKNGRKNYV